jgi:2-dehydropantoate 2-reductase
MQIAIVGPGGIGSTVAFRLARAGHDITVVARGGRLEQLRRDGAIVTTKGECAPVSVSGELDTAIDEISAAGQGQTPALLAVRP